MAMQVGNLVFADAAAAAADTGERELAIARTVARVKRTGQVPGSLSGSHSRGVTTDGRRLQQQVASKL